MSTQESLEVAKKKFDALKTLLLILSTVVVLALLGLAVVQNAHIEKLLAGEAERRASRTTVIAEAIKSIEEGNQRQHDELSTELARQHDLVAKAHQKLAQCEGAR